MCHSKLHIASLLASSLFVFGGHAAASVMPIELGTASSFAVLAGSTVTNTGSSVIDGDLGVSPGLAVTGFPPGLVVNGSTHAGDQLASQAQADLTTAYLSAANQAPGTVLSGQDLGGLTLTSGVYTFASSAQLTGTLTLDGGNNSNAVFLFQIGSTLTTASSSSIVFTQGASGANVVWQVGSSATLGTGTDFSGNILALTSITLDTSARIDCGRALARNGAVTLDDNAISASACQTTASAAAVIPEGDTALLLATTLVLGGLATKFARLRRRETRSPRLLFA